MATLADVQAAEAQMQNDITTMGQAVNAAVTLIKNLEASGGISSADADLIVQTLQDGHNTLTTSAANLNSVVGQMPPAPTPPVNASDPNQPSSNPMGMSGTQSAPPVMPSPQIDRPDQGKPQHHPFSSPANADASRGDRPAANPSAMPAKDMDAKKDADSHSHSHKSHK